MSGPILGDLSNNKWSGGIEREKHKSKFCIVAYRDRVQINNGNNFRHRLQTGRGLFLSHVTTSNLVYISSSETSVNAMA
jgi:hypothetical protein